MGYGKDHNAHVVCPKDNVERKSTKDRSTKVGIENLKSVGRNGDRINQAIQLIQKPDRLPEHFGRRTKRRLLRRPAALPDGSGWTLASAVQSGAELTTNFVPSDHLNGARIQISNPQCDLASPGLFRIFIDLLVKAVNKRVGECRPSRRGQFQSVR
jgi:hypothetical protein